jgi:hypothetical protein
MNDPTNDLTSDLANNLADSGRSLDETLSHAVSALEIHPIIPVVIQGVVVVAVSSPVKISVIDVMTDRSDKAGMNHLRLADATIAALTKVDTIDTKTELNETNLAPRGEILHRQIVNHQIKMIALQSAASPSGDATESSNLNNPGSQQICMALKCGVV